LYTSRLSPTHCFPEVRPGPGATGGSLSRSVRVAGTFIPAEVAGRCRAAMSTLRMFVLTCAAAADYWTAVLCGLWGVRELLRLWGADGVRAGFRADVIVFDILPTAVPLARALTLWRIPVIYYCHFPDKMLTRDTVNGVSAHGGGAAPRSRPRRLYRFLLDAAEDATVRSADVVCVNSDFTREEFRSAFPPARGGGIDPVVLHPCVRLDGPAPAPFDPAAPVGPVVSLNRFERKKDVGLLLRAAAALRARPGVPPLPPVVVAGGHDPRNAENVAVLSELRDLSRSLDLDAVVSFRTSVSDAERTDLLRRAVCVVYTPRREHFGIVPLEAMHAGTPVVASDSGGPRETVEHGATGYLAGDEGAFADALGEILKDPRRAAEMGAAGRERVETNFGEAKFRERWNDILEGSVEGHKGKGERATVIAMFIVEAAVALLAALTLNYLLRMAGVIGHSSSVSREVKNFFFGSGDEL